MIWAKLEDVESMFPTLVYCFHVQKFQVQVSFHNVNFLGHLGGVETYELGALAFHYNQHVKTKRNLG